MWIRGRNIPVNVEAELQEFNFTDVRIAGDKMICCSPFRIDRHPSFVIFLDTGNWHDSGSTDEGMVSGSLTRLIAHLRHVSVEQVEDILLLKYDLKMADTDALSLHVNLHGRAEPVKTFSIAELSQSITFDSCEYLHNRGVSDKTQCLFQTGTTDSHVAMLWTNLSGQVINVKYRSLTGKQFFFQKGGQGTHRYLFGGYQYRQLGAGRPLFITEGEIDAMYLWDCGYTAVALGGGSVSEEQLKLIHQLNPPEIYIATDNDKVGELLSKQLVSEFAHMIPTYRFNFYTGAKDVNEMTTDEVDIAVVTAVRQYPKLFL